MYTRLAIARDKANDEENTVAEKEAPKPNGQANGATSKQEETTAKEKPAIKTETTAEEAE